jgi:hypothetical protein
MNKQDVVTAVAQKTGLPPDICERVVNAIEEQAPGALASEFLGNKTRHAEIVPEDCEKVVSTLESVVKTTVLDKLGFLKGIFSKS